MRIAHIGLASFFTEGMTYQDNQLSAQNVKDGHEVLYISNAAKYDDNGLIVETGNESLVTETGVQLIRMEYVNIGNKLISNKIRKVRGLYEILCRFAPDVILSHGLMYWSVLDVIKYKKENPKVKLYADTHADVNNSGKNWISRNILHRCFYRYLNQKAAPYLESYLCVSPDSRAFAIDNYGIPEKLTEIYPLGGNILSKEDYNRNRAKRRAELGIKENEILIVHSGKLDALKRTDELIKAFSEADALQGKLIIIGLIPDSRKGVLEPLIKADKRINYIGWKSGDVLIEYLCACDLYCQPGSGSATLQNAICCFCPVMAYPFQAYKELDCGNFIWVSELKDMQDVFRWIGDGTILLEKLREKSMQCAEELLDYRKLAARYY